MNDALANVLGFRLRPSGVPRFTFLNIGIDDEMRNMNALRAEFASHHLRKRSLSELADRQIQVTGSADDG